MRGLRHHGAMILVELPLLVAGIFLAFQLESWGEREKQQALLEQHFNNIREEARYNLAALELAREKAEADLKRSNELIDAIKDPYSDLQTINEQLMSVFSMRGIYLKTNAYMILKESGDIRHIEDFASKNKLIGLYEDYRYLQSLDRYQDELRTDQLMQYAHQYLDMVDGTPQARSVYQDPRLTNTVGVSRFWLQQRIAEYDKVIELNRSYLESAPGH